MTSPQRTLHDLALTLPQHQLDRAVNETLVLRLATATGLRAYLARSSRRQARMRCARRCAWNPLDEPANAESHIIQPVV